MSIAERIKSRRIALGLSLQDVSNVLGVTKMTVYRYETKEIENMGLDKLEKLAEALQATPAYLMGWTDDPTTHRANMEFGKLIYSLRTNKKMSAVDLSKLIGADEEHVNYIEAGMLKPDDVILTKLADALGTDYDTLANSIFADEVLYDKEFDLLKSETSKTERKLLLLARKADQLTDEQRDRIIKTFEDTLDVYLDAREKNKED